MSPYLGRPLLSAIERVVLLRLKASVAKLNGDAAEALRLSGEAGRLAKAARVDVPKFSKRRVA